MPEHRVKPITPDVVGGLPPVRYGSRLAFIRHSSVGSA